MGRERLQQGLIVSEPADLSGLRVLVVEDTLLVAEVICDQLQSCGCEVVGPVARLRGGLALAAAERLDGAVLDVNLAGDFSFPIAAALEKRGVPYIFLTGYDDAAVLPPEYRATPRIQKPFHYRNFVQLVAGHFRKEA